VAAKHGDDGGIVANNPNNPEAASMNVTDAKLINLPEKTEFDVVSEVAPISPPPEPEGGLYARKKAQLAAEGFSLVEPDMEPLLNPDGTWNNEPPVFKILVQKEGEPDRIYDKPDDIPNMPTATLDRLTWSVDISVQHWEKELGLLPPQSSESISVFQLDPNQLLTVSGGFKVVLRRPLSSR